MVRMGIDDLLAHRLVRFVPGAVSVALVCGVFSLIGYAIDHGGSFGDSTGAGIGMLVGLIVWLGLLVAFIAIGGAKPFRDRRQARRHERHVEEIRRRRDNR